MQATTTSDLLRQVRNQIRENNSNGITDQEILDTLNRGQNKAVEVLTRNWIYNYLAQETITTDVNGMFKIPEGARGNRIVNVEVTSGTSSGVYRTYSLKKLNYKNVSQYKNVNSSSKYPSFYSVQGREATVYPQVVCDVSITYVRNPEKIVKDAGYIYEIVPKTIEEYDLVVPITSFNGILSDTSVMIDWQDTNFASYFSDLLNAVSGKKLVECRNGNNTFCIVRFDSVDSSGELVNPDISFDNGSTYTTLDAVDNFIPQSAIKTLKQSRQVLDYILVSEYDSEEIKKSDSYAKESYFNIVDSQTGLVKVSLQASPTSEPDSVTGQFKLYPMDPYKQKVLNRPISSPTSLDMDDLGFEDDDKLCSTYGSSVLEIDTIMENFIIQYAVTEIRRSLGNQDMVSEVNMLSQFEKDIKRAHSNRDSSRRVQLKTSTFVKGRYRYNLIR